MTDLELDILQDFAGKASPGVWRVYTGKHGNYGIRADSGKEIVPIYETSNQHNYGSYGIESFDDAIFIAAAKKYMPGLIRELRECREKLRVYEQQESLFRKNGKI